jgi:hypothetical protein
MPAPVRQPNHELEEMTLQALLRIRDSDGSVSNEDVRLAATAMLCSERRVRRMLARNYVRRPQTWQPDADLAQWLISQTDSVPEIHAALRRRCDDPGVSVRTLQRFFAARYAQVAPGAQPVEGDRS